MSFEELSTTLFLTEAYINSRHIILLSIFLNDLTVLNQGRFLINATHYLLHVTFHFIVIHVIDSLLDNSYVTVWG